MVLLIFAIVVISTFTALVIERLLKDIPDQNKEIISLLQHQQKERYKDTLKKNIE